MANKVKKSTGKRVLKATKAKSRTEKMHATLSRAITKRKNKKSSDAPTWGERHSGKWGGKFSDR